MRFFSGTCAGTHYRSIQRGYGAGSCSTRYLQYSIVAADLTADIHSTLRALGTASERTRSFLLDLPSKPPSKRGKKPHGPQGFISEFENALAANPYAQTLASPLRQCLYTRRLYPSTLMVKLIQACPVPREGDKQVNQETQLHDPGVTRVKNAKRGVHNPDVGPWIVPDRILPQTLLRKDQPVSRHGLGKWVICHPAVIQAMIREGKHKIIQPTAFIRSDFSRLVYAQLTMAAVVSIQGALIQHIQSLLRTEQKQRRKMQRNKRGKDNVVVMHAIGGGWLDPMRQSTLEKRATLSSPANVGQSRFEYIMPIRELNNRLQDQHLCVLRFDNLSEDKLMAIMEGSESSGIRQPYPGLSIADISLPPDALRCNDVVGSVTVPVSKNLQVYRRTTTATVPCFNMQALFNFHCPRGYEIILRGCIDVLATKQLLFSSSSMNQAIVESRMRTMDSTMVAVRHLLDCLQSDTGRGEILWVGVRQNEHTASLIQLLWKMCCTLPRPAYNGA